MNDVVPTKLVRKRLFGTVDHDHVDRELEQKLHQISQDVTKRWNFVFETETPLPGRLQWEKNPVQSIAAFYHESTWDKKTFSTTVANEETGEAEQGVGSGNKWPAEVTPGPKKRTRPKTTHDDQTTGVLVSKARVPAKHRCTEMGRRLYI
ncbi:cyclin-dependent kinase inhibitor 1B-like [Vanacampus margaritifer]